MMRIVFICCIVQLFLSYTVNSQLSTTDYDSYGIRFTANDFLIVEAQNLGSDGYIFAIQFYNLCPRLSCTLKLNDSSIYIYSVSIGMNQTVQQQYFAFNGYMNDSNTGLQIPFIGMVENRLLNHCNFTLNYTLLNSSQYDIGDYYVMTVDPQGLMAYGFAFKFIVFYNLHTQEKLDWDSTFYDYYDAYYAPVQRFMPHAVVSTNKYVILAGAIDDYNLGRWVPTVYLIDVRNCSGSLNSSCILSWSSWPQWTYTMLSSTWEMYIANDDVIDYDDAYNPLYDLSIDINPNTNEVLFGIQYFSTVIRLSVDAANYSYLMYIDQRASGAYVGFGKSVKYAADGSIIILANNFSDDYQTWYSSSIQMYSSNQNFADATVIPIFTFPNLNQQLWAPPINAEFLAIHATSVALIFMDTIGNVYVLMFSPPGYYTDSSSGQGKNQIYFSNTSSCNPGTYKSNTGLDWCHLCPEGTFNSGNMTSKCTPCSNGTSFCPLGSVSDTALSFMSRITQIRSYPESPENIIFDDILILNMFSLNTNERRCLLISPLFWALIFLAISILIVILMGVLQMSLKCKSVRQILKKIFRLTDLIGEGEMWIGGLTSFSILILCIFAYRFSNSYLNQYPIEDVGDSSFACDLSLRNAKFSSTLQLLATADTSADEQQQMFNLMTQQIFTLHVLFVNSLFQCSDLTILEMISFLTVNLPFNCSFDSYNSVMSIDVNLTAQIVTVQFIISSDATAGGLSIGLTGQKLSSEDNNVIVQEVDFQEPFSVDEQILTQSPIIELQLIKVLNVTQSLQSSSDLLKYSGRYIPSFVYNANQIFNDENNFDIYHSLSQTTFTLQITNSLYYIQNIQEPIARQSEILFHNLLFTIVCMEIFGLIFLVFKLMLLPLFKFLGEKLFKKLNCDRIIIHNDDDEEEEEEAEMKKRIYAYLKKLEEKDKNNSNTMLTSIAVIPDKTNSSQHQLSRKFKQSISPTELIPVKQSKRYWNDKNNNNENSKTTFGRSYWD